MGFLIELLCQIRFLIGHIGNGTYFPKPLSKDEERILLEKYASGDKDAFNKLCEHNMRLVAHIAKKYASDKYELDDYISIGSIGLIKAVRSFNGNKSAHLVTYAARCVENEILMFLRANKKRKNEVSLSEPVGVDKDGNEVQLIDVLPSDAPEVSEDVDTHLRIRRLLAVMDAVLDNREKQVMILRYGVGGREPLTQRETAKMLDISRSYVSRIEKAAVNKIRDVLCDDFHL